MSKQNNVFFIIDIYYMNIGMFYNFQDISLSFREREREKEPLANSLIRNVCQNFR